MRIKQTKIWAFFSSVKLAIWLLSIIAFFSLLGTLTPRSAIYSSFWFISLLILFSFNLIVCLLNRFFPKYRSLGSFLSHISILVIFLGAFMGMFFGQKDYLKISKAQAVDSIMVRESNVPLGFSLRLDDFVYNESISPKEKLLVYTKESFCEMRGSSAGKKKQGLLAEIPVNLGNQQGIGNTGYKIKVLRYLSDFVMDTATKEALNRSAFPNNPAIEVELTSPKGEITKAWLFARFPDIHQKIGTDFNIVYNWMPRRPKDFISKVTILKDNQEVLKADIRVNAPLKFGGYNFFQSSYDAEGLSWSGLQVVKDPGVPVIYAGFILLILGLVLIFYVNPLTKEGGK